jgi:tetratricopeptide (TPR) repeat protein
MNFTGHDIPSIIKTIKKRKMKKLFLMTLLAVINITFGFAQEDAEKLIKKAIKAYNAFNLEPNTKGASLDEAKTIIDQVFLSDAMNSNVSALIAKGKIYGGFSVRDQTQKILNPTYKSTITFPASFIAFEALDKALNMNLKKYEKDDALKGLQGLSGDINNMGNDLYNAGKYEEAYNHFIACLKIHDWMKANGLPSVLDKPEDYNNQLFIVTAAAMKGKKLAEAKLYNDKLMAANYMDGGVYENQYEFLMNAGDTKGAEAALEEGLKKMPDDVGLMFKQINHYIKMGQLESLVDKLKKAIEKEPGNVSLYTTIGNVYDNLLQKDSLSLGKDAKGNYSVMAAVENNPNYKNAEMYFIQATTKDPKNADAFYGLGAFYYNVAAKMTNILNKLADDYSKEGTKKYDAVKAEVFALFEKSLPSFKLAEALNPNDRNCLIALKEIHARKNEFDISNEYKRRLEVVESGGKNPTSYNKN